MASTLARKKKICHFEANYTSKFRCSRLAISSSQFVTYLYAKLWFVYWKQWMLYILHPKRNEMIHIHRIEQYLQAQKQNNISNEGQIGCSMKHNGKRGSDSKWCEENSNSKKKLVTNPSEKEKETTWLKCRRINKLWNHIKKNSKKLQIKL